MSDVYAGSFKAKGRRSIRLQDYDYTHAGAYVVTICTWRRVCLFGSILEGKMLLSPSGVVVREEWLRAAKIRRGVRLDSFVIMPNHLHGIIVLSGSDFIHGSITKARRSFRSPGSLGSIVAAFKQAVTIRLQRFGVSPEQKVWQRNYFERVIRNEAELFRFRRYIAENPQRWAGRPEA
jgi:putative transposase